MVGPDVVKYILAAILGISIQNTNDAKSHNLYNRFELDPIPWGLCVRSELEQHQAFRWMRKIIQNNTVFESIYVSKNPFLVVMKIIF